MTAALLGAAVFSLIWGRMIPIEVMATTVSPETVKPGEQLYVERVIKRTRPDCERGTLEVTLVDAHRQIRALEPVKAPSGKPPPVYGQVGSSWLIPESMPPGLSIFRATARFPCFPFYSLWPVEIDLPDVMFNIQDGPTRRRSS